MESAQLSFEQIEEYLQKLGKNYSVVLSYKSDPVNQIKIHYTPHQGEFYYSFRNHEKIDPEQYSNIALADLSNISFFSGLLISSFDENQFSELLSAIGTGEHFPIQKPEVLSKSNAGEA